MKRLPLLSSLLTTACLSMLPSLALAAGQANWTFMVYMVGDNDLEDYITIDLETELGAVGSSASVNVVALADRAKGYSTAAGDWTDTRLYYVEKGQQATPEAALAGWGERNMGDPATLLEFMDLAMTHYPADRYALVLWDHGWGWRPYQSMWDEGNDDTLDQHELAQVLEQTGPIDMLAYDACLMGDIEVMATLRGSAEAVVASQDYVGYEGFRYEEALATLQADPQLTPDELAIAMSQSMRDRTIAAVSLDADWDALVKAVDVWAGSLQGGLSKYTAQYQRAFSQSQAFGDPLYVDLYDAASQIKALVPDSGIKTASQAVMDAMGRVMLHEWHRRFYRGAHGLSIFWPQKPADLDEKSSPQWNDFAYYRNYLAFSPLVRWDEFLDEYVKRTTRMEAPRLAAEGEAVKYGAPGLGLPAARGFYSPSTARRGAIR